MADPIQPESVEGTFVEGRGFPSIVSKALEDPLSLKLSALIIRPGGTTLDLLTQGFPWDGSGAITIDTVLSGTLSNVSQPYLAGPYFAATVIDNGRVRWIHQDFSTGQLSNGLVPTEGGVSYESAAGGGSFNEYVVVLNATNRAYDIWNHDAEIDVWTEVVTGIDAGSVVLPSVGGPVIAIDFDYVGLEESFSWIGLLQDGSVRLHTLDHNSRGVTSQTIATGSPGLGPGDAVAGHYGNESYFLVDIGNEALLVSRQTDTGTLNMMTLPPDFLGTDQAGKIQGMALSPGVSGVNALARKAYFIDESLTQTIAVSGYGLGANVSALFGSTFPSVNSESQLEWHGWGLFGADVGTRFSFQRGVEEKLFGTGMESDEPTVSSHRPRDWPSR